MPGDYDEAARKKKLAVISGSSLILVAMVVGAVVSMKPEEEDIHGKTISSSMKAVRSICQPTDYRQTCIKSLADASNGTDDPKELVKASFEVAINEILDIAEHSKLLKSFQDDPATAQAAANCKELFNAAVYDFRRSIDGIQDFDFDNIDRVVSTMEVWISATITYQETCLDGFTNTTNHQSGDKLRKLLQTSMQMSSNGLAIVNGLSAAFGTLQLQPVTTTTGYRQLQSLRNRRLLTTTTTNLITPSKQKGTHKNPFLPSWVDNKRRRLLQSSTIVDMEPDVIVAQDGSGKYTTISDSLNDIPKYGNDSFIIYVKEGVYKEYIQIEKSKTNVILMGDGPTKTRITGNKNFIDGTPTYKTATVAVKADHFMAKDIGFENTAGPEKHQAVALRVQSDQSIFFNCAMDGYQDTLYTHTYRQFYRDCTISGTIDFVFGDASSFFQNCTFVVRKPMSNQNCIVTAQGRKERHQPTGIILHKCSVVADSDYLPVSQTNKAYLGRPWKEFSKTIFIESYIGGFIDPEGWLPWTGDFGLNTCYYGEFRDIGPGAVQDNRVNWKGIKRIGFHHAMKFMPHTFFHDDDWIIKSGVPYINDIPLEDDHDNDALSPGSALPPGNDQDPDAPGAAPLAFSDQEISKDDSLSTDENDEEEDESNDKSDQNNEDDHNDNGAVDNDESSSSNDDSSDNSSSPLSPSTNAPSSESEQTENKSPSPSPQRNFEESTSPSPSPNSSYDDNDDDDFVSWGDSNSPVASPGPTPIHIVSRVIFTLGRSSRSEINLERTLMEKEEDDDDQDDQDEEPIPNSWTHIASSPLPKSPSNSVGPNDYQDDQDEEPIPTSWTPIASPPLSNSPSNSVAPNDDQDDQDEEPIPTSWTFIATTPSKSVEPSSAPSVLTLVGTPSMTDDEMNEDNNTSNDDQDNEPNLAPTSNSSQASVHPKVATLTLAPTGLDSSTHLSTVNDLERELMAEIDENDNTSNDDQDDQDEEPIPISWTSSSPYYPSISTGPSLSPLTLTPINVDSSISPSMNIDGTKENDDTSNGDQDDQDEEPIPSSWTSSSPGYPSINIGPSLPPSTLAPIGVKSSISPSMTIDGTKKNDDTPNSDQDDQDEEPIPSNWVLGSSISPKSPSASVESNIVSTTLAPTSVEPRSTLSTIDDLERELMVERDETNENDNTPNDDQDDDDDEPIPTSWTSPSTNIGPSLSPLTLAPISVHSSISPSINIDGTKENDDTPNSDQDDKDEEPIPSSWTSSSPGYPSISIGPSLSPSTLAPIGVKSGISPSMTIDVKKKNDDTPNSDQDDQDEEPIPSNWVLGPSISPKSSLASVDSNIVSTTLAPTSVEPRSTIYTVDDLERELMVERDETNENDNTPNDYQDDDDDEPIPTSWTSPSTSTGPSLSTSTLAPISVHSSISPSINIDGTKQNDDTPNNDQDDQDEEPIPSSWTSSSPGYPSINIGPSLSPSTLAPIGVKSGISPSLTIEGTKKNDDTPNSDQDDQDEEPIPSNWVLGPSISPKSSLASVESNIVSTTLAPTSVEPRSTIYTVADLERELMVERDETNENDNTPNDDEDEPIPTSWASPSTIIGPSLSPSTLAPISVHSGISPSINIDGTKENDDTPNSDQDDQDEEPTPSSWTSSSPGYPSISIGPSLSPSTLAPIGVKSGISPSMTIDGTKKNDDTPNSDQDDQDEEPIPSNWVLGPSISPKSSLASVESNIVSTTLAPTSVEPRSTIYTVDDLERELMVERDETNENDNTPNDDQDDDDDEPIPTSWTSPSTSIGPSLSPSTLAPISVHSSISPSINIDGTKENDDTPNSDQDDQDEEPIPSSWTSSSPGYPSISIGPSLPPSTLAPIGVKSGISPSMTIDGTKKNDDTPNSDQDDQDEEPIPSNWVLVPSISPKSSLASVESNIVSTTLAPTSVEPRSTIYTGDDLERELMVERDETNENDNIPNDDQDDDDDEPIPTSWTSPSTSIGPSLSPSTLAPISVHSSISPSINIDGTKENDDTPNSDQDDQDEEPIPSSWTSSSPGYPSISIGPSLSSSTLAPIGVKSGISPSMTIDGTKKNDDTPNSHQDDQDEEPIPSNWVLGPSISPKSSLASVESNIVSTSVEPRSTIYTVDDLEIELMVERDETNENDNTPNDDQDDNDEEPIPTSWTSPSTSIGTNLAPSTLAPIGSISSIPPSMINDGTDKNNDASNHNQDDQDKDPIPTNWALAPSPSVRSSTSGVEPKITPSTLEPTSVESNEPLSMVNDLERELIVENNEVDDNNNTVNDDDDHDEEPIPGSWALAITTPSPKSPSTSSGPSLVSLASKPIGIKSIIAPSVTNDGRENNDDTSNNDQDNQDKEPIPSIWDLSPSSTSPNSYPVNVRSVIAPPKLTPTSLEPIIATSNINDLVRELMVEKGGQEGNDNTQDNESDDEDEPIPNSWVVAASSMTPNTSPSNVGSNAAPPITASDQYDKTISTINDSTTSNMAPLDDDQTNDDPPPSLDSSRSNFMYKIDIRVSWLTSLVFIVV